MFTDRRRLVRTLALAFLALVACDAWSQARPTAIEIIRLPKFCYAQAGVPNATGPEFNLPRDCGPGVNHYCSGLIHMLRAKASGNKGKVLAELGLADNDIRYTEQWISNFPGCSLRDHVATSRGEVNGLLTVYGGKPIVTK